MNFQGLRPFGNVIVARGFTLTSFEFDFESSIYVFHGKQPSDTFLRKFHCELFSL